MGCAGLTHSCNFITAPKITTCAAELKILTQARIFLTRTQLPSGVTALISFGSNQLGVHKICFYTYVCFKVDVNSCSLVIVHGFRYMQVVKYDLNPYNLFQCSQLSECFVLGL